MLKCIGKIVHKMFFLTVVIIIMMPIMLIDYILLAFRVVIYDWDECQHTFLRFLYNFSLSMTKETKKLFNRIKQKD